MIYISHRGNINGPNLERENHPTYIKEALDKGFDVEVDLRFIEGCFYLGHDAPVYQVDRDFVKNSSNIWFHAKNIEALSEIFTFNNYSNIHCFFHNEDAATLTSFKYIWCYPGIPIISERCIAVLPEKVKHQYDISKAGGICSDYIGKYKK